MLLNFLSFKCFLTKSQKRIDNQESKKKKKIYIYRGGLVQTIYSPLTFAKWHHLDFPAYWWSRISIAETAVPPRIIDFQAFWAPK